MLERVRVLDKIKEDLSQYALHDKAEVDIAFVARMILLTPGFQFVLAWRIQEVLFRIPIVGRLLRRIAWWLTCIVFGSEIAMGASVDGGLYIPHPYGIVVGSCNLGKRVTILQHVTLGRRDHGEDNWPRIEDGVSLMAGSVVLGGVTVGRNAVLGANAVALQDIPPDSIAVGVPAKILPRSGRPENSDDAQVASIQRAGFTG
jgi:serine O-acetyltransferase